MTAKGVCRFCGQIGFVEVPDDTEQEKIDWQVMLQCNCDSAKKIQLEELNKERALANIDGLYKDCPKIAEFLKLAVDLMVLGELETISFKTGNIGGKVVKKSSGSIKVERTKSEKWSIET